MTKEILDKYKDAYFKVHECYPEIIKKGSWYYVGNSGALRIKQIEEMTENLLRDSFEDSWKKHVAPASSAKEIMETLDIKEDDMKKAKNILIKGNYITNLPDDTIFNNDELIKLLTIINECGRVIFHSKNIKECQRLGKEIVKKSKTLMNLIGN